MEIFEQVLTFASILAVIVTALTQGVKMSINLPKNIVPLVGVLIGLILGAVAYPFTDLELVTRLWAGGIAGLSATGLYELVTKRTGTTKENTETENTTKM